MTWKVMIGPQERVELHKAMVMKIMRIVSVKKLNEWRDEVMDDTQDKGITIGRAFQQPCDD
jgi:hypothetical protein